jgi:hypothetical protein
MVSKYLIVATRVSEYEILVEAEDEQAALATIDDWIADDFEEYNQMNTWDFDVLETQ